MGAGVMILLTIRDLAHRFVRFVVVVVLAAVVFALLFVMSGLVEQFNREPYDTTAAIGGSAWVLAEGVSGPFTASSSLPASAIGTIDAEVKSPVVAARSSLEHGGSGEEIVVVGHVPEALGAPPVAEGRTAAAAGEIVLDKSLGIDVGEHVEVAGQPFEVVGLSRDTTILAGIPLTFMTLEDAQRLIFRSTDVVSGFLVDGDVGEVPAGTELSVRGIRGRLRLRGYVCLPDGRAWLELVHPQHGFHSVTPERVRVVHRRAALRPVSTAGRALAGAA